MLMTLSPRTKRLREWAFSAGQHYGYQGAHDRELIMLRALDALDAGMPLVERRALAFAAMLEQVALHLGPDDLLAGHFSPTSDMDGGKRQAALAELVHAGDVPNLSFTPELAAGVDELMRAFAQPYWMGCVGFGHSNVDYADVLQHGMAALAREAFASATEQADPDCAAACRAMGTALRAVIRFAERHAELVEAQAAHCEPARATELREIAARCRRVPAYPATTFPEALQSVWFAYLAVGMSESPSSNSLGCVDRYLWPFFAQDIANGTLTEADAVEWVAQFLIKCGAYAEGQALTLGGQQPDGQDATNALTRLFLRAAALVRLPEPIIALRLHDGTPDDLWDAAMTVTAGNQGQISYYSEPQCRAMLAARGIPAEDLGRLAINSCMGVVVSGAEMNDMWGGIVNLALCLELAIARGRTADGTVLPGIAALCPAEYSSLDELFQAFRRIVQHTADLVVEKYRQECAHQAQWHPNPLMSALLEGCRMRGLDRLGGGPRYHSVVVEGIGWANVSDALLAIGDLVFQRGATDLATLLHSARTDYRDAGDLLAQLRACPKYGQGEVQADAMAARVLQTFAEVVTAERQPGEHREYLPSLHSLYQHIYAGSAAPVSFDGRRYGAPLNKQLGPSVWAGPFAPTAVLSSAARLPIAQLPGGQALDIAIPHEMLSTPAGRRQFRALVETYFRLGGADLQINTADPADLRSAQAHPEDNGHLIVRVAGYSEFFTKLDRAQQDDLIARISAGV